MPPRTLRCVKYVTGTSSQAFVWAQPNPRPTSSFSTPTSQFPGASRIRPSTKTYYAESLSFSNPWYILSSCCENNLSSREVKGKFSRWPSTAAWERRTRTSWLLSLFSQIMLLLKQEFNLWSKISWMVQHCDIDFLSYDNDNNYRVNNLNKDPLYP